MPQGPSGPDQFLATRRHPIFAQPHLRPSASRLLHQQAPHTAQFQTQPGRRVEGKPRTVKESGGRCRPTARYVTGAAARSRRTRSRRSALLVGPAAPHVRQQSRGAAPAECGRRCSREAPGTRPPGGFPRAAPPPAAAFTSDDLAPPRSPPPEPPARGVCPGRPTAPSLAGAERTHPSPRRVAGAQHHRGSAACPALTRRRAGSRDWHPAAGWVSPRGAPLPYRPPLCAAPRRSSPPAAAHDSRRLPTAAAAAAVPPVGAVSGTAGTPAPALLQPAPQDASCRPGSPRAGRGRQLPAATRGRSGLRGFAVPCRAALGPAAWARLRSLLPAVGDPCMTHKVRRKARSRL